MLVTHVRNFIEAHAAENYVVAYSGGVDSAVLLHVMQQLLVDSDTLKLDLKIASKLEASHVNHNLHNNSSLWVKHCKQTCDLLNIPLTVHDIHLDRGNGESVEALAREKRYTCLEKHVSANTIVLTAHHQDDQAETLLLQLMRGSGPKGLASMPVVKPFSTGLLGRPLLNVSRADILDYAKQYGLNWIDDPSNFVTDYDRNFIRQKIFPLLQQRWPTAAKVMARSAEQCASSTDALQRLAADKILQCQGSKPLTLSCYQLKQPSRTTTQALIRCWLQQQKILMPSSKQLEQIIDNVLNSNVDAMPCVRLGEHEIRRYRDDLYVEHIFPEFAHTTKYMTPLDTCSIPGLGQFYFEKSVGLGFEWPDNGTKLLQIRYRQGGETCQPLRRTNQHKLKKLFQELSVPSWQRSRLPLLYDGKKMIAVADLLVCEPFGVAGNNAGYLLKRRELKI